MYRISSSAQDIVDEIAQTNPAMPVMVSDFQCDELTFDRKFFEATNNICVGG